MYSKAKPKDLELSAYSQHLLRKSQWTKYVFSYISTTFTHMPQQKLLRMEKTTVGRNEEPVAIKMQKLVRV